MISQFILAVEVVLPLFFLIFIGYWLKRMDLYSDQTLVQLNHLTFTIFLPLHLFQSIYHSDLSSVMNLRVVLFMIAGLFVTFGLSLLFIPLMEKENARRGVMIQGIIRCNYIIIGFPIMASLFPPEQLGICALIMAVSMPIFNPMAVISLELFRGQKVNVRSLVINVIKNPFVVSTLIGLVFLFSGIKIPTMIDTTIKDLAKLGTPLALLLLGAAFRLDGMRKTWKQLSIVMVAKLVLVPLLVFLAARLLQFTVVEVTALVIFFAAPTAVSTYSMAMKMGGDGQLAQDIVIYSTLLSVITMVFWIMMIGV